MFQKISWNCFIWYQEFFSLDFLKIFWLAVFHRNVSISRVFFLNFRQEKLFSPTEEIYYRNAKEEDFHGNVLKRKYFKDVQEAKKRSKPLGQKIFTCLDGELYENDEVGTIYYYFTIDFWNLKWPGELTFFFTFQFSHLI